MNFRLLKLPYYGNKANKSEFSTEMKIKHNRNKMRKLQREIDYLNYQINSNEVPEIEIISMDDEPINIQAGFRKGYAVGKLQRFAKSAGLRKELEGRNTKPWQIFKRIKNRSDRKMLDKLEAGIPNATTSEKIGMHLGRNQGAYMAAGTIGTGVAALGYMDSKRKKVPTINKVEAFEIEAGVRDWAFRQAGKLIGKAKPVMNAAGRKVAQAGRATTRWAGNQFNRMGNSIARWSNKQASKGADWVARRADGFSRAQEAKFVNRGGQLGRKQRSTVPNSQALHQKNVNQAKKSAQKAQNESKKAARKASKNAQNTSQQQPNYQANPAQQQGFQQPNYNPGAYNANQMPGGVNPNFTQPAGGVNNINYARNPNMGATQQAANNINYAKNPNIGTQQAAGANGEMSWFGKAKQHIMNNPIPYTIGGGAVAGGALGYGMGGNGGGNMQVVTSSEVRRMGIKPRRK